MTQFGEGLADRAMPEILVLEDEESEALVFATRIYLEGLQLLDTVAERDEGLERLYGTFLLEDFRDRVESGDRLLADQVDFYAATICLSFLRGYYHHALSGPDFVGACQEVAVTPVDLVAHATVAGRLVMKIPEVTSSSEPS